MRLFAGYPLAPRIVLVALAVAVGVVSIARSDTTTGMISGHVVADCPSANTPLAGARIDLYNNDVAGHPFVATVFTDAFGNYVFSNLSQATYLIVPVTGYFDLDFCNDPQFPDACQLGLVLTGAAPNNSVNDFSLHCPQIHVAVGFTCPPLTCCLPLSNVLVDVFSSPGNQLVASALTAGLGDVLLSVTPGRYNVSTAVPLGYTAAPEETTLDVGGHIASDVFVFANCVAATGTPRSAGFWKHQLGVATGGTGSAQVGAASLCGDLDLIETHFNNNALNQVVVYDAPMGATCSQKLSIAAELLNLSGSSGALAQARAQLMALLLNAAANNVGLQDVVSKDGATVSQAITYCDHQIDNPAGDRSLAATIADRINNGQKVEARVIPLDTPSIAYSREARLAGFRVEPNPSAGSREFRFALASRAVVGLALFDVAGRRVADVFEGELDRGAHVLRWNGFATNSVPLKGGLYFARMRVGAETMRLTLVQSQ